MRVFSSSPRPPRATCLQMESRTISNMWRHRLISCPAFTKAVSRHGNAAWIWRATCRSSLMRIQLSSCVVAEYWRYAYFPTQCDNTRLTHEYQAWVWYSSSLYQRTSRNFLPTTPLRPACYDTFARLQRARLPADGLA